MNDIGQCLLQAILDHPAADEPRLVMADWLEENGEGERAEFIRVQIELEPLRNHQHAPIPVGAGGQMAPMCRKCDRQMELQERDWQLFIHHGNETEWGSPEVVKVARNSGLRFASEIHDWFRRGFISAVTTTAANWLTHADTLTASQPIETVTLTTWPMVNEDMEIWGSNRHWRFRGRTKLMPVRDPGSGCHRRMCEDLLAAEWPRIHFMLPPTP